MDYIWKSANGIKHVIHLKRRKQDQNGKWQALVLILPKRVTAWVDEDELELQEKPKTTMPPSYDACPECGTPGFLQGIECPGCGLKEGFKSWLERL